MRLLVTLALLLPVLPAFAQDGKVAGGEEAYTRALAETALEYRMDEAGLHHYRLDAVYRDAGKQWRDKFGKELAKIQAVQKFSPKEGLEFTAIERVTLAELMALFDQRAWGLGDLPFWVEIRNLGRRKADGFPSKDYQLVIYRKDEAGRALGNLGLDPGAMNPVEGKWQQLSIQLRDGGDLRLVINRRTAKCMGHNNYSMRVIDADGAVLWENLEVLGGGLSYTRRNLDEDDASEIILHQSDHGQVTLLVFDFN